MTDTISTFMLPGLGDSGPQHWQSHWERNDPGILRVVQTEWDAPRCGDWVACLDAALLGVRHPVVLVAHSSACALVAHWAVSTPPAHHARVRGALLVAPSDPLGPNYPEGPEGFAPVPLVPLPFPSIVVASDDDPYVTLAQAEVFARAWGSELVALPNAGHINVASGFGPWPEGLALLDRLRQAPLQDETLPPWLATEATLDTFLAAFRDGSFPIRWWTHGAHVAMAASVLWNTPVTQALDLIRERIRSYNLRQGGENTATRGYHETLTRLWIGAVASALTTLPTGTSRLEGVREVYRLFARRSSLFRDWYEIDLLKDQEARRRWLTPSGEGAALFGGG